MKFIQRKWVNIFLLFPVIVSSQSFETNWQGHFSYNNVKEVIIDGDRIYAASENAFFIYDKRTKELISKSTVNGLSGETISTIHYDEATDKLVLGDDTGLIEVFDLFQDEVLGVVDILNKQTIQPDNKRINHIMEYDRLLFIASDFGISLYNIEQLEFDDTYFIGNNGEQIKVRQTTIFEGYIYAATEEGVYKAPINDENLIDFNRWEQINTLNWRGVQVFNNTLYALANNRRLFEYNGTTFVSINDHIGAVKNFKATTEHLIVTTTTNIYIYDQNLTQIANISAIPDFEPIQFNTAITSGGELYIGTSSFGILSTTINNPLIAEEIHPQGPLLNSAFSIRALPNELWVVFGEHTVFYNPFPLNSRGISHLKENTWVNIPFEDLFDARSLVYVTPNPDNTDQVFVSSFYSGLIQIEDEIPTIIYNTTNSSLESLDNGNPNAPDIRIGGTAFDREGNLWILNTFVEEALKMRTASGQWSSFDIGDIVPAELNNLGFKEIVIDRNNYKFFTSVRKGVIGFFENNGSPLLGNIEEGENIGNLPSSDVRALAIDTGGQLWIGTTRGLRVLFSTGDFFNEENLQAEPVIILDDGTPSELLFDQFINDIFVDGSNNKWIATDDSGAFYVSSDGRETIYHFTKENSPLPSNSVNAIEVDGETGKVYFATSNGIVSFQGNAVAPAEILNDVYTFPNPVRPGYIGNVTITGLVRNANVKVTDIEGNLVFETRAEGGSVQWDLTAFGRHKVASGVYMVLISNEDGTDTNVSKIMVIR
ncbi:two-component regulator propeller domain-containing protein [Leptobacterium sp. I13]|uniref:type IX secretion system anionic LPS delivery protein PorZ n=1 Tax=Leptobacterium meishanense TaxID=3128904 RepID=UPI0030ED3FD8